MTRFLHLTDLHLSHADSGDMGLHSDTEATLRRVVAHIAAMPEKPDFVVMSGDLTNTGHDSSYRLLQEIIADIPVPLVLALGNHDKREGFNAVFRDGASDQPLYHDALQGALHVITLDTGVPGRVAGAIDAEQMDFLRAALARHSDRPKLIVMHHPPRVDPDGLPWGTIDMASTEALAETLRGHPVAGILSGHIHINRVSHWHGIPIVVSNGLHSTVDLLDRQDLRIVEGSGFGLCEWRPSGLSVAFVPLTPEARQITVIDRARLLAFS
ncbi:metallophosphoesterase family protein [Seohaeicola zhoushanensis]|uniref:Phosphodiesterase n=1 Tax=Seohaeicola zhoushanensis TaxID=1569283 RepID=A0A8J3GU53_9RHOB|nr:metallophosphoesterase [Seohaeicola zhoushanensis]GHF34124.1 phosphodiesterase [Seohaeicola zhoushanensis]